MDAPHSSPQLLFICSDHPIAFESMHQIISADSSLRTRVRKYSRNALATFQPPALLILDCCSGDYWPDAAIRWKRWGGSVICIISGDPIHQQEQLRIFYLGASGIVPISSDLHQELPAAIHAVLDGKLWCRQNLLAEYVKQGQDMLSKRSSPSHILTFREEQVVSFVMSKFSNKQIADALGISERTVKYHVSNIFRKSQVSNRRELMKIMSVSPSIQPITCQSRTEFSDPLRNLGFQITGKFRHLNRPGLSCPKPIVPVSE